ncbi:hypothetical protein ACSXCO_15010 (plasmid) [Clostridium perfringens]
MELNINEVEFIKSYLDKGYKVNGARIEFIKSYLDKGYSLDMALYLLKENSKIRLIKRKSKFFGLYTYDDCIVISKN